MARSSFSGGIDGRPIGEYRAAKSCSSAKSASFTITGLFAADDPANPGLKIDIAEKRTRLLVFAPHRHAPFLATNESRQPPDGEPLFQRLASGSWRSVLRGLRHRSDYRQRAGGGCPTIRCSEFSELSLDRRSEAMAGLVGIVIAAIRRGQRLLAPGLGRDRPSTRSKPISFISLMTICLPRASSPATGMRDVPACLPACRVRRGSKTICC